MKSSSLRRSQQSLSTRESPQFSQQLSELLRLLASRTEDIAQLCAVVDKPAKKLKCISVLADKLLSDAELREDWRVSREDGILIALTSLTISAAQRTLLEQTTRKMLTVVLKFAPEPSVRELNSSEMHVDNVMSNKVSPQSTMIEMDRSGRRIVTVLNGAPEAENWKNAMWKEARIVEACLYGEHISPTLALSTCVKFARKTFEEEVVSVRSCLETPEPHFAVQEPKRKAQVLPLQQKQTSVTHRSVIRSPTNCCDWKQKMVEMMLDANRDTVRAVANFLASYCARKQQPIVVCSPRQPKSPKTERAKMYEMYGPVSPYGRPESPGDPATVPDIALTIFADIRSPFFPVSTRLSQRLKTVHCVLLIQRAFRAQKFRERSRSAVRIQAWFRMIKVRRDLETLKIRLFRTAFFRERIRHWLKLLAGKRRMRKNPCSLLNNYSQFLPHITVIQSAVRGFLTKRRKLPHLKTMSRLRKFRCAQRLLRKKRNTWSSVLAMEDVILKNSLSVAEQINAFKLAISQGKKVKGFKRDRDLTMYTHSIRKAEERDRKMQLWKVADTRILMLNK